MAYDFSKLTNHIKETEEWLARELSGIRTGRATPSILDSVKAEAYGTKSALTQIASVTIEDARTIRVVPWDKTLGKNIEKAIVDADLGIGVSSDDQGVRVSFPELTAERRVMLGKIARDKLEAAKVTLRGHRADTLKEIDAAEKASEMSQDEQKRYKDEVQKFIDKSGEALEALTKKKEAELAA